MQYSKKLDTFIFNSFENLNDSLDNQSSILNNYIFRKINNTINDELDTLILFYIKIDKALYHIKLKTADLISPLNKCLEKFELEEDYEKCIQCRDLIEKLNIKNETL